MWSWLVESACGVGLWKLGFLYPDDVFQYEAQFEAKQLNSGGYRSLRECRRVGFNGKYEHGVLWAVLK